MTTEPKPKYRKATTVKDIKIAEEFVKGKSKRQACREAQLNPDNSCRTFKKPQVQAEIDRLLTKGRITEKLILDTFRDQFTAKNDRGNPDNFARMQAVKLAMDLKGFVKRQDVDAVMNIVVNQHIGPIMQEIVAMLPEDKRGVVLGRIAELGGKVLNAHGKQN